MYTYCIPKSTVRKDRILLSVAVRRWKNFSCLDRFCSVMLIKQERITKKTRQRIPEFIVLLICSDAAASTVKTGSNVNIYSRLIYCKYLVHPLNGIAERTALSWYVNKLNSKLFYEFNIPLESVLNK